MSCSPLVLADAYKFSHPGMISAHDVDELIVNFTPRSFKHLMPVLGGISFDDRMVWCGFTEFVKTWLVDYFNENFFNLEVEDAINFFYDDARSVIPDLEVDWVAKLHAHKSLPLDIYTLPEGSLVPAKVPVIIAVGKAPCAWIATYIETLLSCESWKVPTVATIARAMRMALNDHALRQGFKASDMDFSMHGFEFRGMSGVADATKCAYGTILSTYGTDTMPVVNYVKKHYNALGLIAASVPASEHSATCFNILLRKRQLMHPNTAHGIPEEYAMELAEQSTIQWYFTELYPEGIASYVADSFDFFKVIGKILPHIVDKLKNRKPSKYLPAKAVFRPDSGDPYRVLVGYFRHEVEVMEDYMYRVIETGKIINQYEYQGAVETMCNSVGYTVNDEGYKTMDSHFGLIYGDGITPELADRILYGLMEKNLSCLNVVFGVGSYTYQHITRDTLGFALKATCARVSGRTAKNLGDDIIHIYKDPLTDKKVGGNKASARGYLRVYDRGDGYLALEEGLNTMPNPDETEMVKVMGNGFIIETQDSHRDILNEARRRIWGNSCMIV